MDVKEKVFEVINEIYVEITDLTEETNFTKDLGWDSLVFTEFVDNLEKKFSIIIKYSEMDNVETVGDAIALVQSKLT